MRRDRERQYQHRVIRYNGPRDSRAHEEHGQRLFLDLGRLLEADGVDTLHEVWVAMFTTSALSLYLLKLSEVHSTRTFTRTRRRLSHEGARQQHAHMGSCSNFLTEYSGEFGSACKSASLTCE